VPVFLLAMILYAWYIMSNPERKTMKKKSARSRKRKPQKVSLRVTGLSTSKQKNLVEDIASAFDCLINAQKLPGTPPESIFQHPQIAKLYSSISEIRNFLTALARGDLSGQLAVNGYIADILRSLQTNLISFMHCLKMVAEGDLAQNIECEGEFGRALNSMIEKIGATLRAIQAKEKELAVANESLQQEVAERKKAQEEECRLRELLQVLQGAAQTINATLDFDRVIDITFEQVSRIIPYDSAAIFLSANGYVYSFRLKNYEQTPDLEWESIVPFSIEEKQPLNWMFSTHRAFAIPDTSFYPDWPKDAIFRDIRSWVGAPILVRNDVVAFLSLHKAQRDFYATRHASILKMFVDQVGLALENARLFAEVQRLATTDSLTGLHNRRSFLSMAAVEYERACRYGRPLSILMIDIDHFKRVNDTLGHAAGDKVLQVVAARCRKALRKVDIIGRYGGEEFLVILPETTMEFARRTAEKIRRFIHEFPVQYSDKSINITVSIGVNSIETESMQFPIPENALERFINRADRALYAAKRAGRNRVECFNIGDNNVRENRTGAGEPGNQA